MCSTVYIVLSQYDNIYDGVKVNDRTLHIATHSIYPPALWANLAVAR